MRMMVALLIVLAAMPAVHAAPLSYSVVLRSENGTFDLVDLGVIEATRTAPSSIGVYTARLRSFRGSVLFETKFDVSTELVYSPPISAYSGAPRTMTTRTFDLLLPFHANARTLEIGENERVLVTIDLTPFALCNENAVCDGAETPSLCATDCTCGNGVCDATETYAACSSDCPSRAARQSSPPLGILVVIGIAVAAVAGGVILLRPKKKS